MEESHREREAVEVRAPVRLAEARQVDRHKRELGRQRGPHRRVGEDALRPRAEQQQTWPPLPVLAGQSECEASRRSQTAARGRAFQWSRLPLYRGGSRCVGRADCGTLGSRAPRPCHAIARAIRAIAGREKGAATGASRLWRSGQAAALPPCTKGESRGRRGPRGFPRRAVTQRRGAGNRVTTSRAGSPRARFHVSRC